MSVVSEAIACLTTLPQRCKPKALKTISAPKNSNQKIQSKPHYVTMRRSRLRRMIKRISRRGSGVKSGNILESGKSRLRPPASIPLMPQRKKRRSVIFIRSRISTAIRKTTITATILSQKTSVSLGNFRAGN